MIILNESKPKYEHLDVILEPKLLDIRFGNQVNIIIDLKEVLKKFFRPDITFTNYNNHKLLEEICSDIINIIAHYRNYFYKKGKYTNFYILDSMEKSNILDTAYSGYRDEFYSKYIYEGEELSDEDLGNLNNDDFKKYICWMVRKLVNITANIFPHVHAIDSSDYGDIAYSRCIIENTNKNELIFILTNDQILFQLVDTNVSIITQKGIKSELVTPENLYKIISGKDDFETNISVALCPLILSLAGVKKYSIQNVKNIGFNKSVKLIEYLIKNEKIDNAPSSEVPINYDILDPTNKLEDIFIKNKELINNNYNIIHGSSIYNRYKHGILNKFSNYKECVMLVIKRVVDVFKNYPIQLDMILKGEKL